MKHELFSLTNIWFKSHSYRAHIRLTHLTIYNCSQWQVIKEIGEVFPDVGTTVLPKTFIIKSIHLSNLPTLVVPTQNGYSVWVSYLLGRQYEKNKRKEQRTRESILLYQIV